MAAKKKKKTAGRSPARATKARKTPKRTSKSRTAAQKRTRRSASARTVSVGDGEIDVASIERLIRLMSENDLVEIEVRNGPDHKVRLSRRSETTPMVFSAQQVAAAPAAAPRPAGEVAAVEPEVDPNVVEFPSPMVGTFYRAPSPESPPYVTTGDRVVEDSILCIIEAMKVLNEIKAEVKGDIVDILVENGEAVEYGQPLFLIRKAG